MSTYIYLNIYANGYMYVGSHTWDGPEGQLDPNYHGSSMVASKCNWIPEKEFLLESVKGDRKFIAEREWIEKYALEYGIADRALMFSHSNGWVSKFKSHGKLLNLHANGCQATFSEESRRRSLETRKREGKFVKNGMANCHTKEATQNRINTIRAGRGFSDITSNGRKKHLENYLKLSKEERLAIMNKVTYAALQNKPVYDCFVCGELVCTGTLRHCCKEIHISYSRLSVLMRGGVNSYSYNSYVRFVRSAKD